MRSSWGRRRRAVVEAGFTPPEEGSPGRERFRTFGDEPGVSTEDEDLVIRRELRVASGRRSVSNRITVNGTAVSVGVLRALGGILAEIYSQGEYLLCSAGPRAETVDEVGRHEMGRGVGSVPRGPQRGGRTRHA